MLEHSSHKFQALNPVGDSSTNRAHATYHRSRQDRAYSMRARQIAVEMCRQADILAKATELRLEVEVRRTYTTLQCELLSGDSTKERNTIYGLAKALTVGKRFTTKSAINWFELAEKIFIRNEVALEMGYKTISNMQSLTDAYVSASRAHQKQRSYELQASLLI